MDFLKQLSKFFTQFDNENSWMLLIYHGVAYLLGILTGYMIWGSRVKKLKRELTSKQKEASDMEMQVSNTQKEMSIQDADMKRLSLELKNANERKKTLELERNRLKTELLIAEDKESAMSARLEETKNKYASANLKINKMASTLDENRTSTDGHEAKVIELEAEILALEAARIKENEAQAARIKQMQKAYDELKMQYEISSEGYEKQENTINTLKNQLLGARRENESLAGIQEKYERQKEGFKDLLVKQNQFIFRIEKLKEQLKELEDKNSNLAFAGGSGEHSDEYNSQLQELHNKLENAHNNLAILEGEKSGMEGELESYKKKTAKLEQEKYLLEEEYSTQIAINAADTRSVESSNSALEDELNSLQNQLKAAIAANDEILATAKREKHDLKLELESLKATFEAAQAGELSASSTDLEKEVSQLKGALVKLKTEKNIEQEHFIEEFNEMKANYEEMIQLESQKLADIKAKNVELYEKINTLEHQIATLDTEKFEAQEDGNELEAKYNTHLEMLNTQLSNARDENMRLLMQLGEIPNGNTRELKTGSTDAGDDSLIREIELLREHLAKLQTEKFEVEEEVDLLEDKLETQLNIFNAQLSKARDENMQLQIQFNEAKEQGGSEPASASNMDYIAEIDALKTELAQLETEKLKNGSESTDNSHLEMLNKQLASKRDENTELRAQIEELKVQLSQLETEKFEVEEDGNELEEKHQDYLASVNTQLSNVRDENMRLQIELEAAKTQISQLETVKFEAEQEVDELVESHSDTLEIENKKLSKARDENMKLLAELSKLRIELDRKENNIVLGGSSASGSGVDENAAAAAAQKAVTDLLGNLIPKATPDKKDDLKAIDGIGSFIEEKLNKIGIYTFEQISYFDDEIIEKVTEAIQFFPGRIKRDNWVGQSKALAGRNKGTLSTIEAHSVIKAAIGSKIPSATADDKDDLKVIKGIGAFIEAKLNGLGIYTYEQLAAFNDDMVETLTTAIEFSPDRIQRDNWVKQARKLAKKK